MVKKNRILKYGWRLAEAGLVSRSKLNECGSAIGKASRVNDVDDVSPSQVRIRRVGARRRRLPHSLRVAVDGSFKYGCSLQCKTLLLFPGSPASQRRIRVYSKNRLRECFRWAQLRTLPHNFLRLYYPVVSNASIYIFDWMSMTVGLTDDGFSFLSPELEA